MQSGENEEIFTISSIFILEISETTLRAWSALGDFDIMNLFLLCRRELVKDGLVIMGGRCDNKPIFINTVATVRYK